MAITAEFKNLTADQITEDLVYDNIGNAFFIADDEAKDKFRDLEENITKALASSLLAVVEASWSNTKLTYEKARIRLGNKHALKGEKWGAVQRTDYCGGGIKFVSCAGHGGFLISDARNAGIPSQLRQEDGAYEEDCDFWIVALFYSENVSDMFQKWNPKVPAEFTPKSVREKAAKQVAYWHSTKVRELIAEFYGR